MFDSKDCPQIRRRKTVEQRQNIITETVYELALQMIDGDLALRELSIDHISSNTFQSTVFIARRMQGSITIFLSVQERGGFIFSFNKQQWNPLDASVALTIEPTLETHKKNPPRLTVVPPKILANPVKGGPLVLLMPDGKFLWVLFKSGEIKTAISSGATDEDEPTDESYRKMEKWTSLQLFNFLSAMESWLRSPSESSIFPFDMPTTEFPESDTLPEVDVSWIFKQISEGYISLQNLLGGFSWQSKGYTRLANIAKKHQFLKDIHPDLAGFYRLDMLNGRISLWLNEEGQLSDKDSEKALKLAFALRRITHEHEDELCLRPFPADFLLEGPFHKKIINAIREEKKAFEREVLRYYPIPIHRDKRKKKPKLKKPRMFDDSQKPNVREFFQSGAYEDSAAIIRIQRKDDEEDREIVLIRGNVVADRQAWFIFQMTVKDFNKEKIKLEGIDLVAGFNGDDRYYPVLTRKAKLSDEFSDYLERVIKTLNSWHQTLSTVE